MADGDTESEQRGKRMRGAISLISWVLGFVATGAFVLKVWVMQHQHLEITTQNPEAGIGFLYDNTREDKYNTLLSLGNMGFCIFILAILAIGKIGESKISNVVSGIVLAIGLILGVVILVSMHVVNIIDCNNSEHNSVNNICNYEYNCCLEDFYNSESYGCYNFEIDCDAGVGAMISSNPELYEHEFNRWSMPFMIDYILIWAFIAICVIGLIMVFLGFQSIVQKLGLDKILAAIGVGAYQSGHGVYPSHNQRKKIYKRMENGDYDSEDDHVEYESSYSSSSSEEEEEEKTTSRKNRRSKGSKRVNNGKVSLT